MLYEQDVIRNLRDVRLFSRLRESELRALRTLLEMRRCRKGEFLFHAGEAAHRLYFLQHGTVKVCVFTEEGEERILDVLRSGDIFGELFPGAGRTRMMAAQAMSTATVWTMTEEAFQAFARRRPDLCVHIVRYLIRDHRRILARLEAFLQGRAGPRLLAVLLDVARRAGERVDGTYLLRRWRQEDLARMAGLHRSTVGGLIGHYRRRGLLGGQRARVVVHHRRVIRYLKKAGLVLV